MDEDKVGKAKKAMLRTEPECEHKCRSKKDAEKVICVISKASDLHSLAYLALGGVCSQPGKVSDARGRTALHLAASVGKRGVAEWLIKHKEAAINTKDHESGYSPLHRAVFYGQVQLAEFLLDQGANLSLNDNDGLSALDHLILDRRAAHDLDLTTSNPCELYAWGSNSNFNLGLGHEHQRQLPDAVEFFRREGVFCRSTVLQKFHSAFLSTSGQVFTCGHGRGGRLGHGNEESQLAPKQIKAFQGQPCKQVALGVDHSVFLLSSGAVWTCGTNAYHQLGQSPAMKGATSPAPVNAAWKGSSGSTKQGGSKFPPAEGIGASRFHSLFWTRDALYTWGLNAGQLGHIKGDKTIPSPKLVSSLNEKRISIKLVASSDGAIVVLTEGGEILALHEYQNRRIASRHMDVAKIVVVGGHLDPKVCSHVEGPAGADFGLNKIVEKGGQDLRVFVLTNLGRVLLWQENSGSQLFSCIFSLNREILMADLAVGKSQLLLLSKDGVGYEGMLTNRKRNERKTSNVKGKDMTGMEAYLSKNPEEQIKLRRIPGIFRGAAVSCDPKGQNFCALQLLPNASTTELPEVDAPSMVTDMEAFLEETSDLDLLHDLVFRVGDSLMAAHKYVVACSSDLLANRIVALAQGDRVIHVEEDVQPAIFEQLLKYAYTKTCDILRPGPCTVYYQVPDGDNHQVLSDDKEEEASFDEEAESAFAVREKKNRRKRGKSKSEEPKNEKARPKSGDQSNAFTALQDAARLFGFHGLTKALEGYRFAGGVIHKKDPKDRRRPTPVFSRKSFPELHDVTIATEDGAEIHAHKCILAARLDYFNSMFGLGWSESDRGGDGGRTRLTMPISSKVLLAVLDYLYRDEAPACLSSSEDPEFVCNLLVVADQLLAPRLIQLCERQLSQLLTLRNAAEVLQFSHELDCAGQIRRSCLQFVCQNLAAVLESRSLAAAASEETLGSLTRYYRTEFLPGPMSSRVVTPYSGGPSLEIMEELVASRPDVTREDILADEMSRLAEQRRIQRQQSSSGGGANKRRSGRRHSSGDKSPGGLAFSRRRNLSSSSLSSAGSDASSDGLETSASNLSLEDLDFEEKSSNADLVLATPSKVDNKHSDRNADFLADFFGTRNVPDTPRVPIAQQSSTPSSKRFAKKSQKERRRELELAAKSTASEVEVRPKWSGWGGGRGGEKEGSPDATQSATTKVVGLPSVPSFSDIMKDQSSTVAHNKSQQMASKTPTKKFQKSSWKQMDLTPSAATAEPASPPTKSVWKTTSPAANSESPWKLAGEDDDGGFRGIQSAQTRSSDTAQRVRSKPLSVTQTEERAMQELAVFYNVKSVFDENITVMRANSNHAMDAPVWKRL